MHSPTLVVSPVKYGILKVVKIFWFRQPSFAALLVAAAVLSSCNLVFHDSKPGAIVDGPAVEVVDASDGVDAVNGNERITKPFGMVRQTGISGGHPSLASDETELWTTGLNVPLDLEMALSSSMGNWAPSNFGLPTLNTISNETDPALSKNGQLLVFASDRVVAPSPSDGYHLYFASRALNTAAFGTPKLNMIVLPTVFVGFDMSPDALKIYIVDGSSLKVMTRTSLANDFSLGKSFTLPSAGASDPSVSFDELEIVYNSASKVVHATLTADTKGFENPRPLNIDDGCNQFADADFSADAMVVVYNCDGKIHIARR